MPLFWIVFATFVLAFGLIAIQSMSTLNAVVTSSRSDTFATIVPVERLIVLNQEYR